MAMPESGKARRSTLTTTTDMKSIKVFVQEIKALAKKGDAKSLRLALDKTTDALNVYPNSDKLLALHELLS